MESESIQPGGESHAPGKLRTWWHPLLVQLLEWLLLDSCEIQSELNVGRMPLRLDILLIRRRNVNLPELARRDLPSITQRLNHYTVIEFKSPTDSLERGDWNKLLGCAHLYVCQQEVTIPPAEITLMVLAPRLTSGFRDEVVQSGHRINEEESGIHRIDGHSYSAYLLETDVVVGLGEPVLTLFSRDFVNHPSDWVARLRADHAGMMYFVIQQIAQFQRNLSQFEVEHMTEHLQMTLEEMETIFLDSLPIEKRLRGIPPQERLKGLPAEERLKGLPAEERLKGLPAEEVLQGMNVEELERLRRLLEHRPTKPASEG